MITKKPKMLALFEDEAEEMWQHAICMDWDYNPECPYCGAKNEDEEESEKIVLLDVNNWLCTICEREFEFPAEMEENE